MVGALHPLSWQTASELDGCGGGQRILVASRCAAQRLGVDTKSGFQRNSLLVSRDPRRRGAMDREPGSCDEDDASAGGADARRSKASTGEHGWNAAAGGSPSLMGPAC